MFLEAIKLLTQPPADVVYYLVILFALEAMLGIAIGQARRSGWTTGLRQITLSATALLMGRVVLTIVALLAVLGVPAGVVLASAVTPLLERAIDLISLGVLAWTFVPLLRDRRELGLGLLVINSVAALIIYAIFAGQWYNTSATPTAFYNASQQEVIWQVWSLALAALSAAAILLGRAELSGTTLFAFIALTLGHVFQMINPLPQSHIAGWVWLAQLTAYPLFAVTVYRQVILAEPHAAAAQAKPSAHDTPEPELILEAARRLSISTDLPLALQQVAAAMAQALAADLVAIGLSSDSVPGAIDLVAIHHPGAAPTPGATFSLSKQSVVNRALERRRPIAIEPDETTPELTDLFGLAGSFVAGPLLVAPLLNEKTVLGVILLGNPRSRRAWSAAETQRARTLTNYVAAALVTAKRSQELEQHIEELGHTLHRQELEATQRRSALETALQRAQTDAQKASTRLAALAQIQKEQAEQHDIDQSWQDKAQQLAEARARLENDQREQQAEVKRLAQLQAALETQLKDAQRQIAQLKDELQRPTPPSENAAAAPGNHQHDVVASMTQELRTPMTSITGYIDLMLSESVGILGAMQRQFLQRVKANVERMDGMLADLIGFTAIDAGEIKIEPEPVDVAQIVEEAVMGSAALFREHELSIRIEIAEGLPRIQADRDSLYQIVSHLLSNAALCSPANSEVIVQAQVQPEMADYLLFGVTDHGGGIPPEDRMRAFHRMYRADHPLIQGLGETGVGLSIAKTLVEAHGGRIWVDSTMSEGSTFTFILPLTSAKIETPA